MDNSIGHLNSTDSITLVDGTAIEISQALRELGASPKLVGNSMKSFEFNLIPGAQVSRVEDGFQVGKSFLPELQSVASIVTEGTRNKFSQLIAIGNKYRNTPAANDEKVAIAA